MKPVAQGLVDIARLVFEFSRVYRVTSQEDGKRKESDTDHTVMLAISACSLADRLYAGQLDLGKIAQFAIVHDLIEAYAGDTDTFGISQQGKEEKEKREHDAYVRIRKEFQDVLPWISETIAQYECLETKEARFVKTVDKSMSIPTHILNKGTYFKERGLTEEEVERYYQAMENTAKNTYAKEFLEILTLMQELITEAKQIAYHPIT
jgi:putative hydrolase of HD superfamily